MGIGLAGLNFKVFRIFALLALVVVGKPCLAQQNDMEFANYYFENGEFDKSALYFEKLWQKNYNSYFYQRLLACRLKLEQYSEAEDLVKKQYRNTGNKTEVWADLIEVYSNSGQKKKKEKLIDQLISDLEANRNQIALIARKLVQQNELDAAEAVYKKGIHLMGGDYNFAFELADLYGAKGNLQKMVEAYIELVAVSPSYTSTVQTVLNRYLNLVEEPERGDLVKNALLPAIQRNPENTVLNELLIWLFYQTRNYSAALTQVKALDKRLKEDGNRVLEFAEIAIRNLDFNSAIQAYEYLLSSNKDIFISQIALAGLASVRFMELEDRSVPDAKTINETAKSLNKALADLGIQDASTDLVLFYAQFKVKYLNELDSAISLLTQAVEQTRINPNNKAALKLALGDYLLIKGDIWEASLLYSQVDKDFKDDLFGAEAKFRNAKISYYSGDFEWAQDQLDVLKASTSKLISNDALDLSLRITDNLGLDSIEEPLMAFAKAELMVKQNLIPQALGELDSLEFLWPGHALADDILLLRANIAISQKNYTKAGEYLQKIIEQHSEDLLADDAIMLWADLNRKFLNNTQLATTLYEKIINDYPSSLFVVEARKRYRELRGDQL